MNTDILDTLPGSPAGEQLRWYIHCINTAGQAASAADYRRYAPRLWKHIYGENEHRRGQVLWSGLAKRIGQVTCLTIHTATDSSISATITTSKGHMWSLVFEVNQDPPHLITRIDWRRHVDFKLECRRATELDAFALAEIDKQCPIVLGESSIHFDRGNDYFAFTRLMEEATIAIAFDDGTPVGTSCAALHRVRVGVATLPIVTVIHLRVLPAYQRRGVMGALDRVFDNYWQRGYAMNSFVSADNDTMQKGTTDVMSKWKAQALRVHLACHELADSPLGRRATPNDAERIVDILNEMHESEEMYVPYTIDSLSIRLLRAPALYSWNSFLLTDRAVVGVSAAGSSPTVVTESQGHRTESRRGVVLDYGCVPGGEQELEQLLAFWRSMLSRQGIDTLSIYTSRCSVLFERLRALGRESELFDMWTYGVAEPEDPIGHGLHVDPIYF